MVLDQPPERVGGVVLSLAISEAGPRVQGLTSELENEPPELSEELSLLGAHAIRSSVNGRSRDPASCVSTSRTS